MMRPATTPRSTRRRASSAVGASDSLADAATMAVLRQRLRFLEQHMETADTDGPGVSEEFLRSVASPAKPAKPNLTLVHSLPQTAPAATATTAMDVGSGRVLPGYSKGSWSQPSGAVLLESTAGLAQLQKEIDGLLLRAHSLHHGRSPNAGQTISTSPTAIKQYQEARAAELEEEIQKRNVSDADAEALRRRLLYDGSEDGLPVGTKVQGMSATGNWSPCVVVQRIPTDSAASASVKLHFEGRHDSKYDEWVDLSRVKAEGEGKVRGKVAAQQPPPPLKAGKAPLAPSILAIYPPGLLQWQFKGKLPI